MLFEAITETGIYKFFSKWFMRMPLEMFVFDTLRTYFDQIKAVVIALELVSTFNGDQEPTF